MIGEFLSEVDRKEVKMIFDHFVVQYCQQSDSKIGNIISSIEEHAHFSVQWSYEQANRILEALQMKVLFLQIQRLRCSIIG